MLIFELAAVGATEAGLHGEDVWNLKLTPHGDSGCLLLREVV